MISTNEFKTNVTVTIDGDAWQVVESVSYTHLRAHET